MEERLEAPHVRVVPSRRSPWASLGPMPGRPASAVRATAARRPSTRPGPERRAMIYEPDIETRPWPEQRRADEPLYGKQIEYLFERSRFYRDKLRAAGFDAPERVGGLDAIA